MSGDTYNAANRIALLIGRTIMNDGGTSHHVSATEVTLPSSTFDKVVAGAGERLALVRERQRGDATNTFRLSGVLFKRGDDEQTIRRRAAAMNKAEAG